MYLATNGYVWPGLKPVSPIGFKTYFEHLFCIIFFYIIEVYICKRSPKWLMHFGI